MAQPRILIACIGNIFLGDDAFGVEVAKRLAARKLPDEVRLKDFGIRGFDLAYALLDEYEVTILVDATPRGGAPGTLYLIEPDLSELEVNNAQTAALDTHGMNPMKVLQMARSMGAQFQQILLVGCEPMTFGSEEQGQMGLSEPVAAAVDEALRMIESLIAKMLATDLRQQAIPSTAT
ncbi:MAG: hydrogenase maturation protease [Acidobacteriota bacterium]|nr:hydrogenase maturation protease [Acidobacteriota bacterium]